MAFLQRSSCESWKRCSNASSELAKWLWLRSPGCQASPPPCPGAKPQISSIVPALGTVDKQRSLLFKPTHPQFSVIRLNAAERWRGEGAVGTTADDNGGRRAPQLLRSSLVGGVDEPEADATVVDDGAATCGCCISSNANGKDSKDGVAILGAGGRRVLRFGAKVTTGDETDDNGRTDKRILASTLIGASAVGERVPRAGGR